MIHEAKKVIWSLQNNKLRKQKEMFSNQQVKKQKKWVKICSICFVRVVLREFFNDSISERIDKCLFNFEFLFQFKTR
jgi:hypothetical protein